MSDPNKNHFNLWPSVELNWSSMYLWEFQFILQLKSKTCWIVYSLSLFIASVFRKLSSLRPIKIKYVNNSALVHEEKVVTLNLNTLHQLLTTFFSFDVFRWSCLWLLFISWDQFNQFDLFLYFFRSLKRQNVPKVQLKKRQKIK